MFAKIGDKVIIKDMESKPNYSGRKDIITHVDDEGQLYGTRGGLAINPNVDEFEIVN